MGTRRDFLKAGGLALTGLAVPVVARSARPAEIQMLSSRGRGGVVRSDRSTDPARADRALDHGVARKPTHDDGIPSQEREPLAAHPEAAAPWDSGFLVKPGDTFEVTFTVEGVYDYFCLPHEAAGMVGRIVVGRPGGPGALPFDYFAGRPTTQAWVPVPEAARAAFRALWQS